LYKILQGLSLKIASFLQLCRVVPRQLNHPCAWGPFVIVLVISIKIKDVNRRVKRAARATHVHMLDVCVHVLDVRVRVKHACLAVSKLFIY
jgi:hypothetical protein